MNTQRAAAGVLTGVILLTGCGTSGDPSASSSTATRGKSPLSEYLGADFTSSGGGYRVAVDGDDDGPTEEQLAQQRRVEDAIAACMRGQGFRYVPVPPEARSKDRFADAFRLPPAQFAAQYGYGISTIDFADVESEDPNTAIRDALSDRARTAYDKALNGERSQPGDADGNGAKVAVRGPGGCRGKALDQVYGAGTAAKKGADKSQEMRRFESLFTDIEALRKRIQNDPEVTAANRIWADCMAAAKQTGLSKPDAARDKVARRFDQLLGVAPGQRKKVELGPDALRDIDPAGLAAVRRFELAVAKADYDCRQKGYDKTYEQVQYAAEREFIDDHKAILEQFKDTLAEGDR